MGEFNYNIYNLQIDRHSLTRLATTIQFTPENEKLHKAYHWSHTNTRHW